MSGNDETLFVEPLKLDQQSLDSIEGVAAKLKDYTRSNQGEHSGFIMVSGSSKNSGEHPDEHPDGPSCAGLISPSPSAWM